MFQNIYREHTKPSQAYTVRVICLFNLSSTELIHPRRQHNGDIAQGAWKTRRNQPWVMQMIVHGFPSRLAALQFEWAWQHPHISRHLRGEDGKPIDNVTQHYNYLRNKILFVSHYASEFYSLTKFDDLV